MFELSVYFTASTGEILEAINPGRRHDISTVNSEKSIDITKISGDMLIEVLSVLSVVCEIMAGNRVIPLKYPINSYLVNLFLFLWNRKMLVT